MKKVLITSFGLIILAIFVPVAPALTQGIEVAPRTTDREIVQRLTRLEEGQKFMIKHFEQRFDDVNRRFDDVNQRFADQTQIMVAMFGSLIALIIALFGYIAWDRRTMFRPIKERLERIELELGIVPDKPSRPASPRPRPSDDVKPPVSAVHGAAGA